MIRLGDALLNSDAGVGGPPVRALVVYNCNPAAVSPDRNAVVRGLSREDLFTVVLEHFQTDTADYADIVLPATTSLEHYDIHKAYGHLYLSLSRPAIDPIGEAKPNTEVFRLLAERMGLDHPCLRETDEEMARQALDWEHPSLNGITFERIRGSKRLEGWGVPDMSRAREKISSAAIPRTRGIRGFTVSTSSVSVGPLGLLPQSIGRAVG